MFKDLSLRAKIVLGNAISLMFLVCISFISLDSMKQIRETDLWVDHTHRVINKSLTLLSSAKDMETGMRGYLLSGKESFLLPYKNGNQSFSEILIDLKKTVSDNPAQVSLLDDINKSIIDWKTNITEKGILLRKEVENEKDMIQMHDLLSKSKEMNHFDNLKKMIDKFISREREFLITSAPLLSNSKEPNDIKREKEASQKINKALLTHIMALKMETEMRNYLLTGDETSLKRYKENEIESNKIASDLKYLTQNTPSQLSTLREIDSLIADWKYNSAEKQIQLKQRINNVKTMDDITEFVTKENGGNYFDTFRKQIERFIDEEEILMERRLKENENVVSQTNIVILSGIIIAILVSIPIVFILSKSIMQPFNKIFKGLHSFSSRELNEISLAFTNVVQRMSQSAFRLACVSKNIDNVSQNLAQVSNRQASSLEETSACTEEISAMVKINVQSAEESRNLSEQVGSKMTDLENAMNKISESNHKISELVKIIAEIGIKTEIIDEIVFQTKLLSFNASVEAERAGEHGRGFAVVAQEVGNLAKMSGKAAKDISIIVKQSINEAESIAKENTQRVEIGSNIVSETKRQSGVVAEGANKIFEASNEQAKGILEISNAVESINKLTQHAASIADTASSSSSELNKEAENLNRMVFKLNGFLQGGDTEENEHNLLDENTVNEYALQSQRNASYNREKENINLPLGDFNSHTETTKTGWDRL